MSTIPTQNAVPSEAPRDLKFNSGKIDEFVTSLEHEYKDRFGRCHMTIEGMRWVFEQLMERFKVDINQAIVAAGYIPMDSFQQGEKITKRNEILRDETTGEYYRWDGDLPKSVPIGSTPESAGGVGMGAWVGVGDASLRGDLSAASGADLIGYGKAPYINRNLSDIIGDIPTNKYFGAKCDGVTDDTEANQEALDWSAENGRDIVFVGKSCISSRLIHRSGSRVKHLGEIIPQNFTDDVVVEVKDDKWRDPYNDGITAIETGDRVCIDGLRISPASTIDAIGILGTDGVDPIITNLRTFNLRKGGVKVVKGYGWNISNITVIAPADQKNNHEYAGVVHETSDSFYSNIIVSGYHTGLAMPGNANQVSKCHCWGMPTPDRETRNMLFGLNISGSGNNVVQFFSDSPKKINKSEPAGLVNGGVGFVISGYNNTFVSPRNLSHESCGKNYGKIFYITGNENTFLSPIVSSYDNIEEGGFFVFSGTANQLNNYVFGGNMQSSYLYPMAGNEFVPDINAPCNYISRTYTHNIIQKNVIGRVVISCDITNTSSGEYFSISLPSYLSRVSGVGIGNILTNLLPSVRNDTNLFSVEPYVQDGYIYFRRLFRAGAADTVTKNMLSVGRAYFDISFTVR